MIPEEDIMIEDDLNSIFKLYGKDMSDYHILYARTKYDYSWEEELFIFQKDGKYYAVEDTHMWNLQEVSELEALKLMEQFEEMLEMEK